MKQPTNNMIILRFLNHFNFKRVLDILGLVRRVLNCLAGRTFLFPFVFIL